MDKQFNKALGLRLFNARKNLGMPRKEVGDALGLHESTIKRYEDGEIESLAIDKIVDFAKVLKVSPEYLMGWDKVENKEFPEVFTDATEARKYLSMHAIFGSDGLDIPNMDDDRVIEFANELMKQMKLIGFGFDK